MIAPSVIEEIERLLGEGRRSFREIGRMAGVSHGTVARVAHGQLQSDTAREPVAEEEPGVLSGPLERCGGCGGTVQMPCRLCGLRERAVRPARLDADGTSDAVDEALRLDLTDQHQARYEAIRARRAERLRASDPPPERKPERKVIREPQ